MTHLFLELNQGAIPHTRRTRRCLCDNTGLNHASRQIRISIITLITLESGKTDSVRPPLLIKDTVLFKSRKRLDSRGYEPACPEFASIKRNDKVNCFFRMQASSAIPLTAEHTRRLNKATIKQTDPRCFFPVFSIRLPPLIFSPGFLPEEL